MKTAIALIIALICTLGSVAQAQEPTPIIPEQTQAQADLARLDRGILSVAEALNHTAAVLTREHQAIVTLPDDRLIALLNANVQRSVAIITARKALAEQVNGFLNQLNIAQYANRAPVALPERLVLPTAEAPQFSMTPEPEPTPTPTPNP